MPDILRYNQLQTKKVLQKLFRHLLNECIWNSFVLYKIQGGEMTHLEFRLTLIERLIEENRGEGKHNIKRSGKNHNLMRLCPDKHCMGIFSVNKLLHIKSYYLYLVEFD